MNPGIRLFVLLEMEWVDIHFEPLSLFLPNFPKFGATLDACVNNCPSSRKPQHNAKRSVPLAGFVASFFSDNVLKSGRGFVWFYF
jgi:hypothetical protein